MAKSAAMKALKTTMKASQSSMKASQTSMTAVNAMKAQKENKEKGSDAEELGLSHEEWQNVNGRFKTAMNKSNCKRCLGECQQPEQRQCDLCQQYIQTVSYDYWHSTI